MESTTDTIEALNETGQRKTGDRRKVDAEVSNDRRKVQRRRLIDPTTCERDYTNDEIEFMQAMDDYKRRSGRMFPTCSEILEVLRGMGYVRVEITEENTTELTEGTDEEAEAKVRTADKIASDLENFDEFEESFDEDEEEFDNDYDDED